MPKPILATPPPLSIRKATTADLPAVTTIEREQFSNPWSEEYFQAELVNGFSQFYVALDLTNSSLVGFLIFWRLGDELELHKIAVARACRQRGYGSSLLAFFVDTAHSWRSRHALLEVRDSNLAAIRLYEKYEFQCIGRRRNYYSLPTEDALVFELIF